MPRTKRTTSSGRGRGRGSSRPPAGGCNDAPVVSDPAPDDTPVVSDPAPDDTPVVSDPAPDDTPVVSDPAPDDTPVVSDPAPDDTPVVSDPAPDDTPVVSDPAPDDTAVLSDPAPDNTAVLSDPSGTGSDDAQAVSAPKKTRAKKNSFSLDVQTEMALVEWIRENEIIWNRKLISFKRTDLKDALWNDKAKELDKTGIYLRGWWRSIKDIFTRLHKKKSGDAARKLTERETWIFTSCDFLRPLVRHVGQPLRSVKEHLAGQGSESLAQAEAEAAQAARVEMEEDEETPPTSGDTNTTTTTTKKSKKRKQDDTSVDTPCMQTLQENLRQSGQLLKQLVEPAPLSRRANFANFVRDSLLTMPKDRYRVTKAAFWDILRKNDMDDDSSSSDGGKECAAPAPSFLAPTAIRPVRPNSAPPTVITPSEQYQPPPHMWRHQAPASSVWSSATPQYVDQYRQAPLQPQYKQQHLQQYQQLQPQYQEEPPLYQQHYQQQSQQYQQTYHRQQSPQYRLQSQQYQQQSPQLSERGSTSNLSGISNMTLSGILPSPKNPDTPTSSSVLNTPKAPTIDDK
ncbi:uncharacterized protein LOC144873000 [Branchiostoma floridae x Branchiostoma japonicum]